MEFQARRFQPVRPAPVHLHERRLRPVLHGPPLLRVYRQRGDLRDDVQLWQPDTGELPYNCAFRCRNLKVEAHYVHLINSCYL